FQAEDGIRDFHVTGVQTCALPILPVPERTDLVRDDAEILGDERRLAERARDGVEERIARPRPPAAVARGRGARRHLPERLERAEVVDPEQIEARELAAEPRNPPAVPFARVRGPVVERVAPELP